MLSDEILERHHHKHATYEPVIDVGEELLARPLLCFASQVGQKFVTIQVDLVLRATRCVTLQQLGHGIRFTGRGQQRGQAVFQRENFIGDPIALDLCGPCRRDGRSVVYVAISII